jgi:putative Mg2+ transporter-C (MgtC) family protein
VVSGIGFIGAGAILRYGITVRGLTTAASLWVVAALGLATALGLYPEAALAAVITVLGLVGLRPLRARLRQRQRAGRVELVVFAGQTVDLGALVQPLADARVRIENIRIDEQEDEEGRRVALLVNLGGGDRRREELLAQVAAVKGVRGAEWRP